MADRSCRPCANRSTRTQRIGRPPKRWIRRCIRGVEKSGGADPKLGGPGAVCGKLWYYKLTPKRRAEIRAEYEARGRKFIGPAIRKPGVLRAYVLRRFGEAGFDDKGRLRCDLLVQIAHEPGVWGRRARFALNLRRISGSPCPVGRRHP